MDIQEQDDHTTSPMVAAIVIVLAFLSLGLTLGCIGGWILHGLLI